MPMITVEAPERANEAYQHHARRQACGLLCLQPSDFEELWLATGPRPRVLVRVFHESFPHPLQPANSSGAPDAGC